MAMYNRENPLRVFTAFSGYDSQCLALDRLKAKRDGFDYELVGWSEIEPNAIKAHNQTKTVLTHGKGKKMGERVPN